MQRVTITLDDPLTQAFEAYMAARGYGNRSEAVRDLIRDRLRSERLAGDPQGECVASLTYVYNHHQRDLAARLTATHHAHHDLTVSTLHVHLSHDHCLETAILRGPAQRIRALADAVVAQPGVHDGNLSILPVIASEATHAHGDAGEDPGQRHLHLEPLT